MNLRLRFLNGILVLALLLSLLAAGCRQTPTPAATPTPEPTTPPPTAAPTPTVEPTPPTVVAEPLYLAIIWHQHQPLYFKDPATGVYQKPWVRVHAAKDYVDMAAILEQYPDIQVTFNLTPSLLRQLLDLESGARDLYEVHTVIPAAGLTDEQQDFIRSRFFDINPKIIARFPRYQQIANDRDNSGDWDTQTWLDLQVLFNLGWTDPDWLAEEPLASLVAQGRDFAEEDKATVLNEHVRLVAEVIPLHKRLQDEGRIEVTMTPFFHPILPLLLDSNLASVAVPDIELPPRFSYPRDAVAQLQLGVDFYSETFGRPPTGMWPAEGAVAEEIVGLVSRGGIQWMASDEEVLARSLGQKGFARDASETMQEPDLLYRPYIVQDRQQDPELYVVFRDKVISDKVGFTYSGSEGLEAAQDFVNRILAIRARLEEIGVTGPHLVSVILDGENAWEHYLNDGKDFLHNVYRLLQEEQEKGTIRTITPSAYIAQFPDQPKIEELWAGSWVSPDYLTWIGEDEENRAWDYLGRVREFVEKRKKNLDEDTLAAVMDAIYTAEGSDWFWWYGADQNSGDDDSFDLQFRLTLQRVYELMGAEMPTFLKVPVIPQRAVAPVVGASALITPDVDGLASEDEWQGGGYYVEEEGIIAQLWYGFDKENLFLRLDSRHPWGDVADDTRLGFYLTRPGGGSETPFSRIGAEETLGLSAKRTETLLGFGANALLEVTVEGDAATATFYAVDDGAYSQAETELQVGLAGSTLEMAIPYASFGKPDAGDTFKLRVVVSEDEQRDIQVVPGAGPAALLVPDLGLTTPILTVVDPEKDDHGSGDYTYPLDGVFSARAYDLTEFAVAEDGSNLIFRFTFAGPLNNDWGAPNGMGIHTLDVYVDAAEGGERKLLPGRNAALPADSGWELAIWAEGWTPGLYGPPTADSPSPVQIGDASTLNIVSDPGQNKITIRVAKKVFAESLGLEYLDPASWHYLALVMSQDGYPSSGVWRVRDVEVAAQQWRLGGAPPNSNIHPRIIDVAYPANFPISQEEALSGFTPHMVDASEFNALSPDDFAELPMVRP